MKSIMLSLLVAFGFSASAQVTKVSLQASGLTCSMCSKAVLKSLQEVSFVEKVTVDIKTQQYNMTFKEAEQVSFDALEKAVADAGFSVAGLKVTANVNDLKVAKEEHVKIGDHYFHFLNKDEKKYNGLVTFSIVDKAFVPAKDFKKYSSMTKMKCIETGKMEACCSTENAPSEGTRIYHAII